MTKKDYLAKIEETARKALPATCDPAHPSKEIAGLLDVLVLAQVAQRKKVELPYGLQQR